MTRNEFRKTVVELARKAVSYYRTDTNFGYASCWCYIGDPRRLACYVVKARTFDGKQSDVFVNDRYLTTLFIR